MATRSRGGPTIRLSSRAHWRLRPQAGIDVAAPLAAHAARPELAHDVWHAAQVVGVLGRNRRRRFFARALPISNIDLGPRGPPLQLARSAKRK